MSYLCKKAVKLFGKPYQPGDIIPTESVLSTRVRALITCGYIADAPAEEPADHNDEPKEIKAEAKGRASSHTTKTGNKASTASQRHSTSGKG